jgi:hypothetical protein
MCNGRQTLRRSTDRTHEVRRARALLPVGGKDKAVPQYPSSWRRIASTFVLHLLSFDMNVCAVDEAADFAVADALRPRGPAAGISCDEVTSSIDQRLRAVAFAQDQAGIFGYSASHACERNVRYHRHRPEATALYEHALGLIQVVSSSVPGRT